MTAVPRHIPILLALLLAANKQLKTGRSELLVIIRSTSHAATALSPEKHVD